MKFCLISLAFFGLASCKPASQVDVHRVWRVNEVINNIHALNGKTIRVVGYLGSCGVYECGFYQDRSAWKQTDLWLTATTKGQTDIEPPDWLGIGGYPTFDKAAKPFETSYVLITGKVNDRCRKRRVRCTDRAPELEPMSVRAWQRPSAQEARS